MTTPDAIYLIGSYLIVSDGEINEREYDILNNAISPSEEAVALQQKIFSDSSNKPTLKDLVKDLDKSNPEDKMSLFDILYKLEYADGFVDLGEEKFIAEVAKLLKTDLSAFDSIRNKYANDSKDAEATIKVSWQDTIRATFHQLVSSVKNNSGEDYSELLSGTSFAKKVKDIAKVSKQDLSKAEQVMASYNSKVRQEAERISKNIDALGANRRKDEEITKLIDSIKETNQWLLKDVNDALENNQEVLAKKERTINYFTIAFMGRTKAGKSTFHKVVTHETNDDIGVGKLRTTRFNRSFYWENIRIVDTPGIGAPGGKTDTETAASIIDEADLICYIVTDDSIQTTEFDFLRPLKERSKPLFIILNIKGDLDHPKRLQRFLDHPLRWRTEKGRDDIQGHFDRINEALGDKYDMSMVEIIPLQLYAAILIGQKERFSAEESARLREGSNIQEYVRKVKDSIYKTGSLKKTQNIYDGCAYQVHQVRNSLQEKYNGLNGQIENVEKALGAIMKFIDDESPKTEKKITKAIETTFSKLRDNAIRFTDQYYNCKKKNLSEEWNCYPDNVSAYDRFANQLETIYRDFHDTVESRIAEYLDDMRQRQKSFEFESNPELKGRSIVNTRMGANIVSTLLTGGAAIFAKPILVAILGSNPAGWMITLFAVAVGLITWGISALFTSKEKKIEKAKKKMSEQLLEMINLKEREAYNGYLKNFNSSVDSLKSKINKSFNLVLSESRKVVEVLKKLVAVSKDAEDNLVDLFAYRILQYLRVYPYDDNENLDQNIIKKKVKAERQYDQSSMRVLWPSDLPLDSLSLASKVTQIKINN